MKTLQVPFTYYPDDVGGTEVYVESLVRHLEKAGVDSVIAAPGDQTAGYSHNGVPVRRYSTSSFDDPADLYGRGDAQAAKLFGDILDDVKPDIVHLHARTRGVSLRVAKAAKHRGLPVMLTYHTPTVSCLRGTLLRNGETVCDGVLNRSRCAACVLQKHGAPKALASVASHLPPSVGRAVAKTGRGGGVWTALRMSSLVEQAHDAIRELFETVDHIVAVCEWVRDVLVRNDVSSSKIAVSRQGLPQDKNDGEASLEGNTNVDPLPSEGFSEERPLRLIFLGRVDPTKGLHVVLRALQRIPEEPLRLDVYAVLQGESEYADSVRRLAEDDDRVAWYESVPSKEVPGRIRAHDALVVPSQCLETGPLVVYEAFAAQRPVIGADLGGIAELVTDNGDGVLVNPEDDRQAWGRVFSRLAANPSWVAELQKKVESPRTMKAVAREMVDFYRCL